MNADLEKNKKSPPLFIVDSLQTDQKQVALPKDEASHAIKVLRMRTGDPVHVTSGAGLLGKGVIKHVDSKQNDVVINIDTTSKQPESKITITLASAIPKGERQAVLLDMAVQLGIDVFVPLDCEFSAVRYRPKMHERWNRIMRSACKQSRRVYFPVIEDAQTVKSLLSNIPDHSLVLYGNQRGESIYHIPEGIIPNVSHMVLLIGPEGGFSESELSTLDSYSGAFSLCAGDHILRTETAAIALLTLAKQIERRL